MLAMFTDILIRDLFIWRAQHWLSLRRHAVPDHITTLSGSYLQGLYICGSLIFYPLHVLPDHNDYCTFHTLWDIVVPFSIPRWAIYWSVSQISPEMASNWYLPGMQWSSNQRYRWESWCLLIASITIIMIVYWAYQTACGVHK